MTTKNFLNLIIGLKCCPQKICDPFLKFNILEGRNFVNYYNTLTIFYKELFPNILLLKMYNRKRGKKKKKEFMQLFLLILLKSRYLKYYL